MASYFVLGPVVEQVGLDHLPVAAELLSLFLEKALGLLGDRDAGAFHAARRSIFEPRAPAGPHFEDVVAGLQLQLVEAIGELAQGRDVQAFVRALIDALGVAGRHRIEEREEEFGVDVVMRGDRLLVGVHLAEQERLDVAPRLGHQMEILHRAAQLERLEHVSFDVDVGREIGGGDAALVQARHRPHALIVADRHLEGRLALAEALAGAVGHDDLERRLDVGVLVRKAPEQRPLGRLLRRRVRVQTQRLGHLIPLMLLAPKTQAQGRVFWEIRASWRICHGRKRTPGKPWRADRPCSP